MVFDHLLNRVERPIHLSFDIGELAFNNFFDTEERGLTNTASPHNTCTDAVDPIYAPSTGTRVAGGLSYREAYFLCEAVARTGKLFQRGRGIFEVRP